MTEMVTFRDSLIRAFPARWRGTYIYRLAFALGVTLDAVGAGAIAAVKMRFPNYYSPTSLALIGQHRRIVRGPDETDAQYAARLIMWRQSWRRSGNRWGLLEELQAYLTPTPFALQLIDNNGTRRTLAADGTRTIDSITWDWDTHSVGGGGTEYVSRFWVVMFPPDTWAATAGDFGDSSIATATLGTTATLERVETVRAIVESRRGPNAHCANIIIVLDPTGWAATPPDGTWNRSSRRNHAARYWRCS
jgi:hypothetical protein